ncbi:hypothetical protein RRG08_064061 [Elysia crispata]|uniref:Uncharacterized protein n=1 Tax=Elysia crispata TaxID=231223 RepID=A0AAE0YFJ6_9GAST|nr:hypothetical protein RRG08_064061 [Elysia crispata]
MRRKSSAQYHCHLKIEDTYLAIVRNCSPNENDGLDTSWALVTVSQYPGTLAHYSILLDASTFLQYVTTVHCRALVVGVIKRSLEATVHFFTDS